jgi:hypothetical protein
MRRALPLLLPLLVLALPGLARAGSISASLARTELTVGSSTQLTIEVRGAADGDPTLSTPEGLQVRWASKSGATQLSRGRTVAVTVYGYRVTATREGSWILGPARVTVDGQTKASESFEVKVTARSGSSASGRSSRAEPARPQGAAAPGQRGGEYYALASVNNERPWVGESFTYDVEMGSFLRTSGQAHWEQPSLNPLASEPGTEVFQDDRQEIIDGRRYSVNTIRVPVFAVEPGPVEIEPATFDMTVVRARRGFFAAQEPVSFESNPVSLRVRPLPDEGRPPDFSGTVGRFRVEAELDRAEVEAGATATLTVKLTGFGSLRGQPVALDLPESIRVYEEAPDTRTRVASAGLRTEVVFRKALVPQQPGVFELPGVELSYFDPEKARYRTARSQPLVLEVTGDPVSDAAVVARSATLTTAKEQVEVLGTDILPLHTGPRMHGDARLGLGSPLILALLLLPLLGFGGLAFHTTRERMAGTSGGRRRLRARAARSARAAAHQAASEGHAEAAEAALRGYLTARLQRSGAALSPDDGPQVVAEAGAPQELAAALGTLLARIEDARYGGGTQEGLAREIDAWIGEAEASWS